jgi:hypothetical protein
LIEPVAWFVQHHSLAFPLTSQLCPDHPLSITWVRSPALLELPVTHQVGSLEGTSSDHPLVEDYSQPTDNYSAPVNGEGSNGEASNGGIPMNHIRTRSSLRTRRATTNPEGGPSGRFHFRRAATSLFTPEKKIGQAPGVFRSIRSILTASCMWSDRIFIVRS